MSDDDANRLAELGEQMAAIDVDATSAQRIAHRARLDIGQPLPKRRLIEPIAVTLLVTSFLVWALVKVLAPYL